MAIRRGCHQQLEEALDVPALLAELDGEPVEQLGMAGCVAGDAEIPAGPHQAVAEHLLPEAIHRDAGRQRVLRTEQPLRKAQAVVRQIGRHRRQRMRRFGLHLVAPLVVVAAVQNVRRRLFRLLLHHVGDGPLRAERHLLLRQFALADIQRVGADAEAGDGEGGRAALGDRADAAHGAEGRVAVAQQSYSRAESELNLLAKATPNAPDVHVLMGDMYLQRRDLTRAPT